jgi:hypothetical protein
MKPVEDRVMADPTEDEIRRALAGGDAAAIRDLALRTIDASPDGWRGFLEGYLEALQEGKHPCPPRPGPRAACGCDSGAGA